MSRGPLIAAWTVALAVLGGAVAWIETAGPPERSIEPAVTLVLPDRPQPAATAPTEQAEPEPQSSAEAPDRKSVAEGKSVSVRVDIGCRRILTKKERK